MKQNVKRIQNKIEAYDHLPAKQSILDAMEHLFARYLEIRPLFLVPARPIKEEWKIRPYFGVFPFFFRALRKRDNKKNSFMGGTMVVTNGRFQKISIPIPWTAFWNSEGREGGGGGVQNWDFQRG